MHSCTRLAIVSPSNRIGRAAHRPIISAAHTDCPAAQALTSNRALPNRLSSTRLAEPHLTAPSLHRSASFSSSSISLQLPIASIVARRRSPPPSQRPRHSPLTQLTGPSSHRRLSSSSAQLAVDSAHRRHRSPCWPISSPWPQVTVLAHLVVLAHISPHVLAHLTTRAGTSHCAGPSHQR